MYMNSNSLSIIRIEQERNRVVILNAWQCKPMLKVKIKNQPSCGDQILIYNILLTITFLLLIISKKLNKKNLYYFFILFPMVLIIVF